MTDLNVLIGGLSPAHALQSGSENYRAAFITAATSVFPAKEREAILRDRFFVPEATPFSTEPFIQAASELSVAHDIVRSRGITAFETEKRVNPTNEKDVDVFYRVAGVSVAVEVKCSVEPKTTKDALVFKTAGRIPEYKATYADLKGRIETVHHDKTVELGKNKDNTMKDFLVSAHEKFSPNSDFGDLNLLLVACGYYFNIQEWWYHLYGTEGLFTERSFYSPEEYALVDAVLLTNLKYWHSEARDHHDWTMQNVFVLPCLNPRRRQSATAESIINGLSVFKHHLRGFGEYTPTSDDPEVPKDVLQMVGVNSYVAEHLSEAERTRYFPIKLNH
jgi:hypothetical protein